MTDEQELRAKIGAYADRLSFGQAESGGGAVASYLRLILLGVTDPRHRERAAEAVLAAHLRRDITGCVCGWSELGESHPRHQAHMLSEAGLLKED